MGCYLHGIFASDEFRGAFLGTLRPDHRSELAFDARVEATLDALADHLERHVDLARIWGIANAR
jgi:adenosylcobyric acid synthase